MSKLGLDVAQRQSPIGIAIIFFKNLRIAINILISVVAVSFGMDTSFFGLSIFSIGIIVIAIFLVISFLQYRKFMFYVEGNYFVIEKGLISRDKITVPLERIQTVNIKQNVVQQLLKVVAISIDTAGSDQKEMEISALSRSYATSLQEYLMAQKKKTVEQGEEDDKEDSAILMDSVSFELDIPKGQSLVNLSFKDLLKLGLTENHLRTALLVFAVVNGYVWQYEEYLLKPFEKYIDEQADYWMNEYLILVPLSIVLFLIVSVLISMIQTILKYFNLQFYIDRAGVRLISGLLKRNEIQIPEHKIQILKITTNPLRKLIGLKTLIIKQASSSQTVDKKRITVPGCNDEQEWHITNTLFPESIGDQFTTVRPNNYLLLRMTVWLSLLPSLLLGLLGFVQWEIGLAALLYLPISLFFINKYYSSISLCISPDMISIDTGWVFPTSQNVKLFKLQSVGFKQSIFEKRRGLASLVFYTAAGHLRISNIDERNASTIYNNALYTIESAEQGWM